MSIILDFYDIKSTVNPPETFSKLIQRARLEYSFEKNKINEGLLIYTYKVDSMPYGISSETDYAKFKDHFAAGKVKEINILEKQGSAQQVAQSNAVIPEVYEEYMQKVIQTEIELAGQRIKNFLPRSCHVFSFP